MDSWILQGWETNESSKGVLKLAIMVQQRRRVSSDNFSHVVVLMGNNRIMQVQHRG